MLPSDINAPRPPPVELVKAEAPPPTQIQTLKQFDSKTDVQEYGKESYWRDRYAKDLSPFEWFVSLSDVKASNAVITQLLKSRIASKARVLEIGCGTSTLAAELWDMGFKDITACDYQESVIKAQKDRQAGSLRKVVYEVQDMRDLKYPDGSFDLVIEKGAIDALVCSSMDDAKKGASELYRVLRAKPESMVIVLSNAPLMEIPDSMRKWFEGQTPWFVRNSNNGQLMAKCYLFSRRKKPL